MQQPTQHLTDTALDRSPRPQIAIALGDPAGIGPEVILKALANPALTSECDITIVGSSSVLQHTYDRLKQIPHLVHYPLPRPDLLHVLEVEVDEETLQGIMPGKGNAASGEASFRYLETAIAGALNGDFHGIVTAPIAKSAWHAAKHFYPGQTELLAERAGIDRFGMLFVARSPHTNWTLRTLLATTHISLRQVPDALTPDLMTLKLELLIATLAQDFGITTPRIAIAGLNPHSGEQGQLGQEEVDWLIPWIKNMGDRFPNVRLDGPIPPDTMWVRPGQAWHGSAAQVNAHDGYLALYHDQGLIPVKLLAFDQAVNTTIGLPFIRTSPDHGTAFDIAGRGVADAASMQSALQLAVELVRQRMRSRESGVG
ncbi:4-hydroxythreonine-4-phosphate dehydrogenase PdxA [Oscillatoria sp. FACHB-1407]|uniref:4-hydroxythreonine-4-phosphate dehydrogenase PdxA n=1 Tax=Oscillatoria sp. FACHB-1407 TaxID=2692847 RepID=UPI001688AFCD|nr:4-hydroxythreonine-4-phosphate dehydrogenase PdxA [Oscillatoria sp. FACHB-1407]MBD2459540.1 4-hydroxythreonine-4-phosphate dehydrogenase PdxA [Oscillatoria sp. FACHB-1407]